MPWLKGTAADVREIGWRETVLTAADLKGVSSAPWSEDMTVMIRKRITEQSWQAADRLVRKHLYPIGILRVEFLDNSLGIPAGLELYCVLAVRELREERLSLDELEDLTGQVAGRLQGELEPMLERGIAALADDAASSVFEENKLEDGS